MNATVRRTRSDLVSGDDHIDRNLPAILTCWHGEHFMLAAASEPQWKLHAMISRSADGAINAIAAQKLGIKPVRGSGETKRGAFAKGNMKGGMTAFRAFTRILEEGACVSMTADVPKIARVVSPGLVKLARLSGRPIYPCAYVTHPHIALSSWDRAKLNLPFTRAALGTHGPIYIGADEGDDADWCALIKARLDEITDHCYALTGRRAVKHPPRAHAHGEPS
ncbi:MAG: DUF374 domain-containing protein [Pseudomonadota bacterium]